MFCHVCLCDALLVLSKHFKGLLTFLNLSVFCTTLMLHGEVFSRRLGLIEGSFVSSLALAL